MIIESWLLVVGSGLGIMVLLSLAGVYFKLRDVAAAHVPIVEPQAYAELQAAIAKLTAEYNYAGQENSRLTQQLQISEQIKQTVIQENKELSRQNLELVSIKGRLEVENEHLAAAYAQLEKILQELKSQLNHEFTQLKNMAINELKERAEGSLRDIGKESVVVPLQEHLKELQFKINELSYQTQEINRNSVGLTQQAQNLALALTKDSKKKGEFGEMILANILESVGLQQNICYIEQAQLQLSDNKRLVPDVIVKLPHKRAVIIDSKNIMQRYYEGVVNQEDKRKVVMDAIRQTIKDLSSKDYISAVTAALDRYVFEYAIMFIPNEGLFSLIIEEDQKLQGKLLKDAYQQQVFIAGPSTLLVLLAMIEHSWEIYQVEERAATIVDLASELTDKFKTSLGRIADLGQTLRNCGSRYDDVIKSLDNGASNSAIAKLAKVAELSGFKGQLTEPQQLGEIVPRLPATLVQ